MSNMTVRTRLILLTILGLAVTMTLWGWIQLRALNDILVEQQVKRLHDLAETVSTYYQHFPSGKGLSALDDALEDHMKSDDRLARIDLFSVVNGEVEYIVGAGRVPYEWPESVISSAIEKSKTQRVELNTDGGPALGLLYPFLSERDTQVFVGVISPR
jgi:two-component system NtrC family sensor kinase